MLNYVKLDVKDITKGLIVQGVNCQGVMNSGIAKDIRTKYPGVFKQYKNACDAFVNNKEDLLGMVVYYKVSSDLVIANLFSQLTYGRIPGTIYADSKAIYKGMVKVLDHAHYEKLELFSPKIGCGLGGLNWENVKVTYELASTCSANSFINIIDK